MSSHHALDRALLRLLVPLTSLALPALAQAPLPQLQPGPYPVAYWDWNFGSTTTTNPIGGAPLTVSHYGRLYYPTDGSAGALPPVSGAGSFPLVVFGHGRFHTAPYIGNNHKEAGYLMQRLASWGLVATSVNLDVVGSYGNPAAIPQRGDILLDTIKKSLNIAAQPGTPPVGLAAAIDATRIGLMGHSRGGEGAVACQIKNLALPAPHAVKFVATIASTDFQQYTSAGLPYLALYGSKDGDVNNGWPIYGHDRSTAPERVFEYIHGANHFWFTETITCSCEGNADISRQLHHDIAMGYMGGFAVQKLSAANLPMPELCDGDEMATLTSQVEILPMYRHPERLVIDNFESNTSLHLASSGGGVAIAGFGGVAELSLNNTANTFYHLTRGFDGAWMNDIDALWAVQMAAGFDASAWTYLSLKFAQRQNSPINVANVAQDVSVGIMDGNFNIATVKLSSYGKIPWPATHSGGGVFPKKTVLRTTRVPLSAFSAANPALDLTNILFMGWICDQTSRGELAFDDLELTR